MKLVITLDIENLDNPSKEELEEIAEAIGRFCAIHHLDANSITVQSEEVYESYYRR